MTISFTVLLYVYAAIAGGFLIASLVALSYTWRFRYLGPATYAIVAALVSVIGINIVLTVWYILRNDWSYELLF